MPSFTTKQGSSKSTNSGYSRGRRSDDSYDSQSTAPTSIYTSLRPSEKYSEPEVQHIEGHGDLSPGTSFYPRSSVDTYASTNASEEDLTLEEAESPMDDDDDSIPPLPSYHHEITEPNLRPSTPKDFAQLFPSMNRLSIRHDDFTSDGNMNLRVDTVAPGRRRTTIQLFHLRMYDLAKREFSLRRYCRDSGREVCNSKRKYTEAPAPESRPKLQRSMTSAMKTFTAATRPQYRRTNSSNSTFPSAKDKRPGTSYSTYSGDDEVASYSPADANKTKTGRPLATNTIKLEFSNYARVDVERRGQKSKNNKRYEFQWWGHRYSWKRVVEKHLDGVVSYHLLRDGDTTPVAHIVPETRSPNQVAEDERAGGWVPPCYMWINDKSVIEAATDVAE